MVVWTANNTSNFFQEDTQMAIPQATIQPLANEGIVGVEDLAEFSSTDINHLAANFRKDANNIVFGVKSIKRLTVAANAVRFYKAVQRDITPAMMQWTPVLANFEDQYKALLSMPKFKEADVPKITKYLPIMKF